MGNLVSSIFGGGVKTPKIPDVTPMPQHEDAEPLLQAVRDGERRKLRARNGGVNATLLTSPLGTGGGSGSVPGLLGRAG